MVDIIKNSALCTRVCAMSGRLLGREDYEALMNMRSVPAVAAYLAENTTYSKALKGINPETLHRGRLERLLRENLTNDIKVLTPFAKTGSKVFLGLLTIIDEIGKIKICLRLIHIKRPGQVGEYISQIRLNRKVISSEAVAGAADFDGFIALLSDTPYYAPLKIFEGKPDRQRLFDMETALDAHIAAMLCAYARKYLPKKEAKIVLKAYGTEFDIGNLSFLLRCKKTFDMTEEELYAGIIPQYYRLKRETVARIVGCGSFEEAVVIIADETPYAGAFCAEDGFAEKRQREYIARLHRRLFNANRYSIMAAIYYIQRRHIETDNIISVVEGIRYGLAAEDISRYIVAIND